MNRPTQPTLSFFFFNDTATTEIYTLSLHDALPISLNKRIGATGLPPIYLMKGWAAALVAAGIGRALLLTVVHRNPDRKSTRLNSSHSQISYAVFCLKKKKDQ